MTIDILRVHRVQMPLVRPFRTSFGTETVRDLLLVQAVTSDGAVGWGECVTMHRPAYSAEFTDGAITVLRDHLVPALAGVTADPRAVRDAMEPVRGHYMAKSAVQLAVLDAWLRSRGESLAHHLGAVRDAVDCGVSVGIPSSLPALLYEVDSYVEAGYRRIKLKIEPGWDLDAVAAVRERHPDIPLQVDANQAYGRQDIDHLTALDAFDLLLIEQPLHEDDWFGHVLLGRAMSTPVCLDESILSAQSARSAIELGATSVINVKPGRMGGYLEGREVIDVCAEAGIPAWVGGMLETGVGRAANIALAALPGCTLPGDTSASDRYYSTDVTEPFVLVDGQLRVPQGPGTGVVPIPEVLEAVTVWREEMRPA